MTFFRPRDRERFEREVLCHLDSGYNLARWLMSDENDAADALQNSAIRAYKGFSRLRSDDPKSWFLAIVRNECMSSLRRRNQTWAREWSFEEGMDGEPEASSPENEVMRQYDREAVREAIGRLPKPQREVVFLREIEDLSYSQIAEVVSVPIGTVMSRLARARAALKVELER